MGYKCLQEQKNNDMNIKSNTMAMAALMMGSGLPSIRYRTKSMREVNDDLAHQHRAEMLQRRDRYRQMLIRSGRVKDYGHCIAINDRNAERKAAI